MIKPNHKHAQYTEYSRVSTKCRDAAAGERAVKSKGFAYLKPLSGQIVKNDTAVYDAYLDRASYFNATGRTVETMTGLIFGKAMAKKIPGRQSRQCLSPSPKSRRLAHQNIGYF